LFICNDDLSYCYCKILVVFCTVNLYTLHIYGLFHILSYLLTLMDPWNIRMHMYVCVCLCVGLYLFKNVRYDDLHESDDLHECLRRHAWYLLTGCLLHQLLCLWRLLIHNSLIFQDSWHKLCTHSKKADRCPWWDWIIIINVSHINWKHAQNKYTELSNCIKNMYCYECLYFMSNKISFLL